MQGEEWRVQNRTARHAAFPTMHFSFKWGRGRQAMHLPCKQAYVGALPTDSTILRSEPADSWRRAKDALHSLWATEGSSFPAQSFGWQANLNCGKLDQCTEAEPHKLCLRG